MEEGGCEPGGLTLELPHTPLGGVLQTQWLASPPEFLMPEVWGALGFFPSVLLL